MGVRLPPRLGRREERRLGRLQLDHGQGRAAEPIAHGHVIQVFGRPNFRTVISCLPPFDWDEPGFMGPGMIYTAMPATNAVPHGAAAARKLHQDGHQVVVIGRSPQKTTAVAGEIGADHFVVDFTRLDEVRKLAAELDAAHPRIDVLANNAGGVFGDPARTPDGFEMTFQIYHLAPFLLNFRPVRAYGAAKLENILFTRELHRRCHDRGISSAAFHPGSVATSFGSATTSRVMRFIVSNRFSRSQLITPEKGADQLVWIAGGRPGVDWESGTYYEKRKPAGTNRQASDDDLARRLWDRSEELVA